MLTSLTRNGITIDPALAQTGSTAAKLHLTSDLKLANTGPDVH
jgi:hypothetical protein